ncbi:MAG: hypothetical protein HYX56_05570 [Chloroflexi bacterium]|nr:hypothetical protein [Chloroflexota bacterium]
MTGLKEMGSPVGGAVPAHAVGIAYAIVLSASLTVLFGLALVRANGREIGNPDLPVLVFLAAVVGLLVRFRPRPPLYAAGLVVLLTALAGAWAGSPDAGPILSRYLASAHDQYGNRLLALLMTLFPLGWLLLAASVWSWRRGLVTYLITGLVFASATAITGFLGSPAAPQSPQFVVLFLSYALLWPQTVLVMLGIFGYAIG